MLRKLIGVAVLVAVAGCGGSGASNPAERLLLRTGAQQYDASTHPKVVSAHCTVSSGHNYSCVMKYDVTPPSGPRHELQTTVAVSCSGKTCTADWTGATVGQALAGNANTGASSAPTATGGPPPAAKVQLLTHCLATDKQYAALAADVGKVSASSPASAFSQLVADAATYNTDLRELASSASTDQQARLSQYEGVITQLSTSAQDAAGGDLQSADEQLAGVAPQIGKIPALVNQICGA